MMSSTEWPVVPSEAGKGTKPFNILALHSGGMIDEADSRLGSSDWGWLPGLGHPECFPPKGQLYLPLLWPSFKTMKSANMRDNAAQNVYFPRF